MARNGVYAAATATVVGLLFAATIGVDGVVMMWVGLSLFHLPTVVIWAATLVIGAGLLVPVVWVVRSAWRVERDPTISGT